MQINKNNIKIKQSNIANKSSNITKSTKKMLLNNKLDLALATAAVSGAYITKKASEKKHLISELNNLGFENKSAQIILNKKDDNGNKIFSNENIKIFSHLKENYNDIFNDIIENSKTLSVQKKDADNIYNKPYLEFNINNNNIKILISKNKIQSILNDDTKCIESKVPYENEPNKYKYQKSLIKQNEFINAYKTDITPDILGVMHSASLIMNVKDNQTSDVQITESDGTKHIIKYNFNDEKELTNKEIISVSKEGVIKAKTEVNYDYSNSTYHPIATIKTTDYENNKTETDIVKTTNLEDLYDFNFGHIEKTIIKKTNPANGEILTEISELSPITGIKNTVIIDTNGNQKTESLGKINPDGSILAEQHLISLDGTTTEYKYHSSADKKSIDVFYQIKDKDGNILTTIDRKFKHINDNMKFSSLNGHGYAITYNKENIEIKDLQTGDITKKTFSDLIMPDCIKEQKVVNMVKNLPADAILSIANNNIRLTTSEYGSFYSKDNNIIKIGENDNMSLFMHELGHAKDFNLNKKECSISNNKEFRIEYEKEKAAYIKSFQGLPKTKAEYTISELGPYEYGAGTISGPKEAIADINSIISGFLTDDPDIQSRQETLKKYFPKSIAVATKLLNPNANITLTE